MVTALDRYWESSERRRRRAERANIRLDIQGLRGFAVLALIATHLWDWPRGGFVGIDVFFVISGFLVTDSLLRSTEQTGSVPFRDFYWNRVRRIVPAAALVLLLTFAASVYVLPPPGAHEVGITALFALFFVANWHFAVDATAGAASPLHHYWALSVEEQFYLLWPVLIFVVAVIAVGKGWPRARWLLVTAVVTGVVVAASFGWALYESASSPAWAYLSTVSRVWELGVGALLATAVSVLARIPDLAKPLLSWAGVGLIGASVLLISSDTVGFPAPWALLPVAGTALVIAAGVGREPNLQGLLRNRVATYLGDISYSLYLVHWPVIILVGTMMATGLHYSVTVLALTFGLAIACYHLIENPMRYADRGRVREARRDMEHGLFHIERSTKAAAVAALALLAVSLIAYAMRPDAYESDAAAQPAYCCEVLGSDQV